MSSPVDASVAGVGVPVVFTGERAEAARVGKLWSREKGIPIAVCQIWSSMFRRKMKSVAESHLVHPCICSFLVALRFGQSVIKMYKLARISCATGPIASDR